MFEMCMVALTVVTYDLLVAMVTL